MRKPSWFLIVLATLALRACYVRQTNPLVLKLAVDPPAQVRLQHGRLYLKEIQCVHSKHQEAITHRLDTVVALTPDGDVQIQIPGQCRRATWIQIQLGSDSLSAFSVQGTITLKERSHSWQWQVNEPLRFRFYPSSRDALALTFVFAFHQALAQIPYSLWVESAREAAQNPILIHDQKNRLLNEQALKYLYQYTPWQAEPLTADSTLLN